MQPIDELSSQPGQPPPHYREVLYWRISEKLSRVVLINLLSLPVLFIAGFIFFRLASSIGQMPTGVSEVSLTDLLPFVLALLLVPVLHELVHGLTMRRFGAHPKYGVLWKMGAVYATSPGYAFTRRQYVVVALAPLVILSLLAILLIVLLAGSAWVAVIAVSAMLNASGATGDLWITALVLRYPDYAYVVDERDGMRILLPGDEIPAARPD